MLLAVLKGEEVECFDSMTFSGCLKYLNLNESFFFFFLLKKRLLQKVKTDRKEDVCTFFFVFREGSNLKQHLKKWADIFCFGRRNRKLSHTHTHTHFQDKFKLCFISKKSFH